MALIEIYHRICIKLANLQCDEIPSGKIIFVLYYTDGWLYICMYNKRMLEAM